MANNVITIAITGVTKGLNRAVRETTRDIRKLNDSFGGIVSAGAKFTTGIAGTVAKLGLAGAAAGGAAGAVGALGSSLATIAPALGVLPALGAAGAAGIAALTVGLQGMGDALSASSPEELNEALANLSPAAADAARAIKSLGPAATEVRKAVQERLFAGLATQLTALGNNYLPVFRTGLGGIASEANSAFSSVAKVLNAPQSVADTKGIFERIRESFAEMAGSAGPLTQALLDLTAVGSEFLPGFAEGASGAAQRFADFISAARESGQLKTIFSQAFSAIGDLFGVIRNVGSIVVSVFGAANTAGTDFLGLLRDATGGVADFLDSAEGSKMLSQIFTGLQGVLKGLSPVVKEIGKAFQTSLAPAVETLGPMIGKAFASLAPAIQPFAKAIADLAPILGEMVQLVAGALSQAVQTLAPLLPQLGQAFLGILQAVQPLVPVVLQVIQQCLPPLLKLVQALTPVLAMVAETFGQILQAIAPVVVSIAETLIPIIEQLMPVVETVFNAIRDIVSGVMQAVQGIIDTVMGVISGDWSRAWNGIKNIFSGIGNAISGLVRSAFNTVLNLVTSAMRSLGTAIKNGISNAVGFFKNLGKNILSAIGNFGQLLFNVGRDLLGGLWRGIQSLVGWLRDKIFSFFSSLLPGWVKDIFGIRSPSRMFADFGRYLVLGLAKGMSEMEPALKVAKTLRDKIDKTLYVHRSLSTPVQSYNLGSGRYGVNNYTVNITTGYGDPVAMGRAVTQAITAYERSGGR